MLSFTVMNEEKRQQIARLIEARHRLLKAIREFFYETGYLEVETPYLMKTAPPDPYIDPLEVFVGHSGPYYLHTSPEMGMKKMLAGGHPRIFQICKAFRVEDHFDHHRTEFTMAEWYLQGTYLEAMEETRRLVIFAAREMGMVDCNRQWKEYELKDLFIEFTGVNPFPLTREALRDDMERRGFYGVQDADTWEDLFFKLFIQEVEPRIEKKDPYFIKDWPASITAMAKKKGDYAVERFELYMSGMEIANGYTELLDPGEQRERLARDNSTRVKTGKKTFKPDEEFLSALPFVKGPVAGVSLGVDRLLMVLLGKKKIGEVLLFTD